MTTDLVPGHIYHRDIDEGIRTSLSVISGLIGQNAQVLDLGTGSGALGKQLSQHQGCQVDGVTYNKQEAEIASPFYRRVAVADLETCSLNELFPGTKYDFIVCADVLEHIRNPERLVGLCKELLTPVGKLLVSVPNLSYSGLVAELMGGEFLYRDEGLLDRTHVRFFTRRSLARFLSESGWVQSVVEVVERPLNESEFKVQFDTLPPSVARHLLALPDAMAYQFVAVAKVARVDQLARPPSMESALPHVAGKAFFSSQLYLGTSTAFSEDRKLAGLGVIGEKQQILTFEIPKAWHDFQRIRFDPADREGYCYLYKFTLLINGEAAWAWRLDQQGAAQIGALTYHQVIFRPPIVGGGSALLFLTGSDPWIELPIPDHVRDAASASESLCVEVEMGWPMSSDYLALADSVEKTSSEAKQQAQYIQKIEAENQRQIHSVHELAARENQLQTALGLLRDESLAALAFANARTDQMKLEKDQVQSEKDRVQAEMNEQIAEQLKNLNSLQDGNDELQASKDQSERTVRILLAEKKTLADERTDLAARLDWIENSRLFKLTRPLVKVKMRINPLLRRLQGTQKAVQNAKQPPSSKPSFQVDIVVPVYKGLEDTKVCILSVLSAQCLTPFRLIVINDASPEPEVTKWLRDVSVSDSRILLLENELNLGFVATVNRGMSVSDSHDVVLLNSDTEVANDWLDRLKKAAYVSDSVGTVTPFSNNATICSYPAFCEENPMVPHHTTASLDRLFATANPAEVADIPTGVGFCMFIRRECLSAIGLFDVANFGKGYGEENDFCRRAAAGGWRNLHALDTFVLHAGGVSFGASKNERVLAALQTLARLYPDYDALVQSYIKSDPAWTARIRVDALRIQALAKPSVLFVLHDRSGGTVRHATELAEHLSAKATFFSLTPLPGGNVSLRLLGCHEGFCLEFSIRDQLDSLMDTLRLLGIGSIHYHHLIGHGDLVKTLPQRLGVPYDFTAHDYYTYCPQISLTDSSNKYCGELGLEQCKRCLGASPAPGGVSIENWRSEHKAFLLGARRIIAPSRDCQTRIARFSGRDDIVHCPHTDLPGSKSLARPKPRACEPEMPLKIAVIGALSPIKGADVLADVASEVLRCKAPFEFHLIGYAYRPLKGNPESALKVHGAYQEQDLAKILDDLNPHVVWFPALWPETYSYTLSAALAKGLPVIGPDLGAFRERLEGREWSWIADWDQTPSEWIAYFENLRTQYFSTSVGPVPLVPSNVAEDEWSYQENYIDAEIKALTVGAVRYGDLYAFRPGKAHSNNALKNGAKHQMLALITRLRSAPALSHLTRQIPLRWQTRLKSWLRA